MVFTTLLRWEHESNWLFVGSVVCDPECPVCRKTSQCAQLLGDTWSTPVCFGSGARGGERHYYLGSADLMPRNLDRRVEALAPVRDPELQLRIDEILDVLMADENLAWELAADGSWSRVGSNGGSDAHVTLQDLAILRSRILGPG